MRNGVRIEYNEIRLISGTGSKFSADHCEYNFNATVIDIPPAPALPRSYNFSGGPCGSMKEINREIISEYLRMSLDSTINGHQIKIPKGIKLYLTGSRYMNLRFPNQVDVYDGSDYEIVISQSGYEVLKNDPWLTTNKHIKKLSGNYTDNFVLDLGKAINYVSTQLIVMPDENILKYLEVFDNLTPMEYLQYVRRSSNFAPNNDTVKTFLNKKMKEYEC